MNWQVIKRWNVFLVICEEMQDDFSRKAAGFYFTHEGNSTGSFSINLAFPKEHYDLQDIAKAKLRCYLEQ